MMMSEKWKDKMCAIVKKLIAWIKGGGESFWQAE